VEITPALLTAIAGLATAIAALVKAIRGDARKLEESPSSAAGALAPSDTGTTSTPSADELAPPSSATPPAVKSRPPVKHSAKHPAAKRPSSPPSSGDDVA
jgi:hypothetical protein